MTILPSALNVPIWTARTIELVGENVTHRDLSYVIAVAWIAARKKPFEPQHDHWRIPDNRLRGALGRSSRDDRETEESRFYRLRDSILRIDGADYPAPTVMFRNDMPVRNNLDDELSWIVDAGVVAAFVNSNDEVLLPRTLLADARGMTSMMLGIRLIALSAGRKDFRFRMTLQELQAAFSLPKAPPSILLQRYLEPAIDDLFKACAIAVDMQPRKSPTANNSQGRIRDVMMRVQIPEIDDEELPTRNRAWKTDPVVLPRRRGRPKRPAPADTSNVVALQPLLPFSTIRPGHDDGRPIVEDENGDILF